MRIIGQTFDIPYDLATISYDTVAHQVIATVNGEKFILRSNCESINIARSFMENIRVANEKDQKAFETFS